MRVSFQYSLRGLMLGLTALLVLLGAQVNSAHRQRDAIAELADVTHDVEYDYQRAADDAPINYSREPRGWPWLRHVLGSDYFDTVVGISIDGIERPISDRDVMCLSQFKHLRYASVGGASSITPGGCDSFARISPHIRDLYLDNVPGDALRGIAKLKELRVLWFTRAATTDLAINSLASLGKLQELVLNESTADDAAIATLTGLTSLTRLDLERTPISDSVLPRLAMMSSLQSLNLAKTTITDEGLKHLAKVPSLRYLDLTETAITDTGAVHLKVLHNLKALCVARTSLTAIGVNALRRALPDCRIDTSRASPEGEDY